jgi:hypothetical protein
MLLALILTPVALAMIGLLELERRALPAKR